MYKTLKVEESTHTLLFSAKRYLEHRSDREINIDTALSMILEEFWKANKMWRAEEP